MTDLLVPFDRFDRPLPEGLPLRASRRASTTEVSSGIVDLQDPCWTGCVVDLTAPREVDGEPVRLDALEWGVGRLGRMLGILRAEASLFRFRDIEALTIQGAGCRRILVGPSCSPGYVEGAGGLDGGVLLLLTDWPTLDGLDEDAALRAIVAAALRARVGLGEVGP